MPTGSVKYLGVTFDPNLNFDKHIVTTVSSCMSILSQINRIKHIFSKDLLIIIINALVFSKLFYCSSVLLTVIFASSNAFKFCSTYS